MNKKIISITLIVVASVFIIFSIFKKTYAYDYKDYDYTLFYKEDRKELTSDIERYIYDIDYLIYNNSDFSIYDNLNNNYEFMVNFAIDYINTHKDKYQDKIVLLEAFKYTDNHHHDKVTNEYIDIDTIYDITNKYFGVKDFVILNNNINIINKYVSLSSTTNKDIDLNIYSIDIEKKDSVVQANIKYTDDSSTNYIYTFKIDNNILKLSNVEVR